MLQYLALYLYGLLKTPLVSPITQNPPRSQYFDMVADLKYQMNSMSPEEVVPFFYPQIYDVSDPQLSDAEFPPVSKSMQSLIRIIFSLKCFKEKR